MSRKPVKIPLHTLIIGKLYDLQFCQRFREIQKNYTQIVIQQFQDHQLLRLFSILASIQKLLAKKSLNPEIYYQLKNYLVSDPNIQFAIQVYKANELCGRILLKPRLNIQKLQSLVELTKNEQKQQEQIQRFHASNINSNSKQDNQYDQEQEQDENQCSQNQDGYSWCSYESELNSSQEQDEKSSSEEEDQVIQNQDLEWSNMDIQYPEDQYLQDRMDIQYVQ